MDTPRLALAAIALLVATPPALAQASAPRLCMTEPAGYYADSAEQIRTRLADYRGFGVEMLRVETGWERGALPAELLRTDLRVKLILYVLGIPPGYSEAHPGEAMVDQYGIADWHFGPWHSEREAVTARVGEAQMRRLAELGVLERIDEVAADLGPAGEGIYPANWTLGREGEEAFWCYAPSAQADFRRAMERKYGALEGACDAWSLPAAVRPRSWDALQIPQAGTEWARGRFWDDMLTWYRDAKRAMLAERIDQTVRVTREYLGDRARVIVYLPGTAYTQEEWERAVATAGGSTSIRLMCDNDWLMRTALEKGCILQYTGCENVAEVARIVAKLRAAGQDPDILWAENAGVDLAGRDPMWLAQIVSAHGLRGLDFTWSSWLYEADHVTPSATHPLFAEAANAMRQFAATVEPLPVSAVGGTARLVGPDTYELTPSGDARVFSSFPEARAGWDPEIAVVSGGQTQHLLLRFPLELLPKGARIASATLGLCSFLDYGDRTTVDVSAFRITRPWQEQAVTWRMATLFERWERAGCDAVGANGVALGEAGHVPYATSTIGPVAPGDPMEWDVTELVREWCAGQHPNDGLLLALMSTGDANKSVASREHRDPEMRPTLTVRLAPGT